MLFDFFDNNDNFDENTSWNNEVSTTKKFSKKEKESFLARVKKATLAEIEPTSDIVLDQGDTPGIERAVEFLGWAEVLPEFGDQIDYPKDENGIEKNVRAISVKDKITNFIEANLKGRIKYTQEQPWATPQENECEPYLFFDAKTKQLGTLNRQLLLGAGRTRFAGANGANAKLKTKEGRNLLRVELPNGKVMFFVAVIKFHDASGESAAYWEESARGLENNVNRVTEEIPQTYSNREDEYIIITNLINMKGIDLNDDSESTKRAINRILEQQKVKEHLKPEYRLELKRRAGVSQPVEILSNKDISDFFKSKGIVKFPVDKFAKRKTDESKLELLKKNPNIIDREGRIHVLQLFEGSGATGLGTIDRDYDDRVFRTVVNILRVYGKLISEVVIVGYCNKNTAEHIQKIREYKSYDLIEEKVVACMDAVNALHRGTEDVIKDSDPKHYGKKVTVKFLPQISNLDVKGQWVVV